MSLKYFAVLALAVGVFTVSVPGQDTPRELRDLIGVRASSGESELRKRGYEFVKSDTGGDRVFTNWWNNSRRQCIIVGTANGRYASIVTAPAFDCNRNENNSGGGGRFNPPNWAVGTFYGSGPNGERITLSIGSDGNINANVGGSMSYGNWGRSNTIIINGATSVVTRTNSGIATTRRDNSERIEYSRTPWNDNNAGGSQVSPPNWAVGTFYGTGPNGERITLMIGSDGNVRADVNGSMSSGSFTRGNFLVIGGARSLVTRNGDGIATTRRDNGERIEYSRNRWNSGGKVDVSDLIGVRASSGESELRNRGFRNVDNFSVSNTRYMIWWRNQSRQCLQVVVANGRYDAIDDIGTHPRCR